MGEFNLLLSRAIFIARGLFGGPLLFLVQTLFTTGYVLQGSTAIVLAFAGHRWWRRAPGTPHGTTLDWTKRAR